MKIMSYTMLYRKYRPKTFDALVGQEHVVRILTNQVVGGNIGHAYLFTGSRGVGKTSAAKLFARAINCLRPVKGSPCYKCEACVATGDPSNVDITEIDAASNNGVDEIRDLREKVKYPPVAVRHKVYIIDEVHMLTGAAFNAMLKTLEEPPAHTVFILATTEVHKLPATILSRCMRFDFRLVPIETLIGILKDILTDMKKAFEPEALYILAAAADGSVRDMLSLADMCISYSVNMLTAADVSEILGAADSKNVVDLAEAVLLSDGGRCIEIIDNLVSAGKSPVVLAKDLAAVFRAILIYKTCGNARDILHLTAETAQGYAAIAADADVNRLFKCAETFARLDSELRYGSAPRVLVEIACLELAGTDGQPTVDSGQRAVERVPRPAQMTNGKGQETNEDIPTPNARLKTDTLHSALHASHSAEADVKKLWGKVVKGLRERNEGSLYAIVSEKSSAYLNENVLVLRMTDAGEYESLSEPLNLAVVNGILEDSGYTFRPELYARAGTGTRPDADARDVKHIIEMGGGAVKRVK